jgi:hypothetical protein
MTHTLMLLSGPRGQASLTTQVAGAFAERLTSEPGATLKIRDLAAAALAKSRSWRRPFARGNTRSGPCRSERLAAQPPFGREILPVTLVQRATAQRTRRFRRSVPDEHQRRKGRRRLSRRPRSLVVRSWQSRSTRPSRLTSSSLPSRSSTSRTSDR